VKKNLRKDSDVWLARDKNACE